ncbi:hypothetical protein H5410_015929 [Solanum commersonii]|uniref:Uncharacterized protein n=1 Tax=Solanum commersonii TaxID=4109 RepID=A0A9J5ZV22_SOLCO|nr:hypothetical protein H5410_015929 [Solanum commersonii]
MKSYDFAIVKWWSGAQGSFFQDIGLFSLEKRSREIESLAREIAYTCSARAAHDCSETLIEKKKWLRQFRFKRWNARKMKLRPSDDRKGKRNSREILGKPCHEARKEISPSTRRLVHD